MLLASAESGTYTKAHLFPSAFDVYVHQLKTLDAKWDPTELVTCDASHTSEGGTGMV